MKPKVSIVLTCYNLGAYLQEALDSIATYPHRDHYEVIIVDDGSTDPATMDLIDSLKANEYRIIRQENLGLAQARNNGIQLAVGAYIIPLDADNRLRPAMIENTIAVLDAHPEVDVVYGNAEYFGERTGPWIVGEYDFKLLLERNRIDACAGFRKSLWGRLGGYDIQMPVMGYEDWDLWLRASVVGGKFHYVPKVFFDYRVRTGSMLGDTMKQRLMLLDYIFNKPELQFLRALRTSYLEMLERERNPVILTGRDHLRLLTEHILTRIGIGKATS